MNTEQETIQMAQTEQTSIGIRKMLFEELDNLRNGESSPQRANAIAKICGQIISSVKFEIEYARFVKDCGSMKDKIEPLILT